MVVGYCPCLLLALLLQVEFIHSVRNDLDGGPSNLKEGDLKLDVTFPDLTSDKGFLIGSLPVLAVKVGVTNLGELDQAPTILFSWWRLELTQVPEGCSPYAEDHNQLTYQCKPGPVLEGGGNTSISFEFDMSSIVVSEQTVFEAYFNVTAMTESEPGGVSRPVSQTILLPFFADADLFIEGDQHLETLQEGLSEPEPIGLQYDFSFGLEGPSPVANVMAVFDIPQGLITASGTEVNFDMLGFWREGPMPCHATKGQIDIKTLSNVRPSLNESELGEEQADEDFDLVEVAGYFPMEDSQRVHSLVENGRLILSCKSPSVSCIEVTCKIAEHKAETRSNSFFRMEIQPKTILNLMESYSVDAVQIESRGRLIFPDVVKAIQPATDKPESSKSIRLIAKVGFDPEAEVALETAGFKPASTWDVVHLILSVIVGLLMVVGLSFCLYWTCLRRRRRRRKVDWQMGAEWADQVEMNPLRRS